MTPNARARIEKNVEFHEKTAEAYATAAKPKNGDMGDADAGLMKVADMHAEAAAQLRDVLGAEAPAAIDEAMANRQIIRGHLPRRFN